MGIPSFTLFGCTWLLSRGVTEFAKSVNLAKLLHTVPNPADGCEDIFADVWLIGVYIYAFWHKGFGRRIYHFNLHVQNCFHKGDLYTGPTQHQQYQSRHRLFCQIHQVSASKEFSMSTLYVG